MKLADAELAFLAEHHSAAMVTVNPEGIAKVARVGVALIDGKLWSSGTEDRVRTKRLRRDPRCTLYVHDVAFAFEAMNAGPDPERLRETLVAAYEIGKVGYVLSNHDFDRLATRFGINFRAACLLFLSLPGPVLWLNTHGPR